MDNNTNITNGFLIIYVNHHYNKIYFIFEHKQ